MSEKIYELVINSRVEEIRRVEVFIKDIADTHDFPEDFIYNLMLVVTEAINNAVIHGNRQDEAKKAILKCTIQRKQEHDLLVVEVKDEGLGFDLGELPDPLAKENLLKSSGRGVFLMKQFAKVEYDFSGSGTTVKLHLKLVR